MSKPRTTSVLMERIMNYKFTVIPELIGGAIGGILYSLFHPDFIYAGPIFYGFAVTMICMGVTKQAEWY